ncbi:DUF29 domain-containing protein [Azospirillum sp. YIM B02556]|uniref:DUF29 domain-containing protein n=1 Tax=Azospirillum endophyticum TaxID=2800326 RepID=A0ABS1FCW9_9PROT|nr:DUF29 domain-containing protein [Azospirillum endophyticum]MBK1841280.1 DUF29 domain-containing protein [Azospirillum endophyticum]
MDSRIGYDTDFLAWTEEQARLLREASRERINTPIDWENVAEEIESMGRSELRAVESALVRVIEHLLKLEHSPADEPRAAWKVSVLEHRDRVARDLSASPSLRGRIDTADIYKSGRKIAALGLERDGMRLNDLPAACPYLLDKLLDEDWWPTNRHGLT